MKQKIKSFFLGALRLAAAIFIVATVGSGAIVVVSMLARFVWRLILYGFNYFA